MKQSVNVGCLLLYLSLFFQLLGYQPNEGGLVPMLMTKEKPFYLAKEPLAKVFEHDSQGNASCVLRIEGPEQFKQFVLACSKPVVLLVWAATSLDSLKMKPVFIQAAEQFKDQVQFAAMDLLVEQDKNLLNYQIIVQIMQSQGISKIDIPLTVFLKDGSLFTPSYFPPAFLQGPDTSENLVRKVKDKFFPETEAMAPVVGTDVSVTTTVPMNTAVDAKKTATSGKTNKSWWQRLVGK